MQDSSESESHSVRCQEKESRYHSKKILAPYRIASTFAPGGPMVRFHVGLEDVGDLIADLERGFAALAAAK